MFGHTRPRTSLTAGGQPRQRGATLLFVLAFLVLVFTVLTALLGYAFTTARSADTYRREKTMRYTTDGALEAAVQMVKLDTDLGVTTTMGGGSPPGCALRFDFDELTGPGRKPSMTAGSYLQVACEPTPTTTSGGADADGGQRARDVTFTVTCATTAVIPPGTQDMQCGGGPNVKVLGSARVRFDPDYGHDPAAERAIVPKVVAWRIYR